MYWNIKNFFTKGALVFAIIGSALTIYDPSEIDQTPKPYTTGIKIKSSRYKTLTEPYYHSNYSKVLVHNKNYTSSLLDAANVKSHSVYPVYISNEQKIKEVLKEHNTNVVEKDTLNDRVVYKRRIEKSKNIEVFNRCPKGVTGQFVYDLSCNQYLDCWNGRGGPRNCAPGTLFNPKTLECDFPQKVECLTGPTGSSITLQKSAKIQVAYEQAKCPQDFSGLMPNYTDCSKFVQCNNGIQTPRDCPPGTLFDTNLNVCNHANQAVCFSGRQHGTSYSVKEEYGGSADISGLSGGKGYNRYIDKSWQHQMQTAGNQYNGQFYGQGATGNNKGCDPTNPYCNTGGYIISGHNIYSMYSPQGYTRDSRYYPGFSQASGQGTVVQQSPSTVTVYVQYVMCNPSIEDCSGFQQGTYMLGSGGALCNPVTDQCGQNAGYLPSNKMPSSADSQGQPAGNYFIKYVMCNTMVQNCSQYQQGVIQAAYGVPGTLIGAKPVGEASTGCNPQTQNCGNTHYGKADQPCNPQYQQCDQAGFYQGQFKPPIYPGSQTSTGGYNVNPARQGPRQFYNLTTTTNYKKVCSDSDPNCYYNPSKSQTTSHSGGSSSSGGGKPKCPTGFQGLTKHPNDCKKFLNCANGMTFVQDCAPGTVFNPILKICDFPYNVDCKDGEDEATTINYGQEIDENQGWQGPYDKVRGCQGQSCQNPLPQGQPQNQGGYGQTHCQGTHCSPGQGHSSGGYQGGAYGQPPCQGTQCGQTTGGYNQGQYGQNQGAYGQTGCQGTQCSSIPGSYNQGQFGQGGYPQTGCQGGQCPSGQGSRGQGSYSQTGSGQSQVPGGYNQGGYAQAGCQGIQCGSGQGQSPGGYNQGQYDQGGGCQGAQCGFPQPGGYNQGQSGSAQAGCQGIQCGTTQPGDYNQGGYGYVQVICQGTQCSAGQDQAPDGYNQGGYSQQGCQGTQCGSGQGQYQGSSGNSGSTSSQGQNCQGRQCQTGSGYTGYESQTECQGYQCTSNQGQVPDNEDTTAHETSTQKVYTWPTRQGHQRQNNQQQPQENSHIMKIPTKTVSAINKSDRETSNGFNNQRSIDYVDIFDPDETRNLGYATTTPKSTRKPEKQVWPPPFPDLATTDVNADYVFEYEDGEPVTLAPENVQVEKRRKSRCGANDFMCDKRSCIAKNFVCDGVRDCDDGKDEKYCQKYLDEFKPYKNFRLDVLEKQRWDNISYSTCALLCMDASKFECKSFNYRKVDKACFLTDENVGSSGALKSYYPCDYYERKSLSLECKDMHKCPSGKCLTSEQVCDGYDDCGDRADEKGCRPKDFGYSVNLAAGNEPNEGRIEITVFGKTGYICDDQFTMTDANVLCKELGFEFGALEVRGNSYFARDLKENHTLYMMDDIQCLGNETSLMQCDFAGWGIHNCADGEIAGIVCKTPEETCKEGYWKCDTGNECVRLPFVCDGLDDCTDNSDEARHHCDAPTELRLVNGSGQNEGRLEIRHNGIWGSICDDDFNEDAAKIVCNYMGFQGSAAVKKDAFFGQSDGPIWLDQVSCKGNESSLQDCSHWEWGETNCDHSEDVGIVCSNSYIQVEPKRNSKHYEGSVSGNIADLDNSQSSPEPVNCGFRKGSIFLQSDDVHFRVVQGALAKPGEYPWQAALRIKGKDKSAHWCGAVVIASKWVLTAAHCLEGYPKGAYVVVAGEYDIDENEGTEQQAFIEEYYLHKNFRKGHKMGNDIAMILLKGNGFKLNQDIQPICLPDESSDYERDLNCTISGFGTVQTGRSAYSHKLRAAWIPVQKMDVCKMAHIYGENIGEGMICAGDLTGGIDACDGDSGGPLACLEDGVFTLYGLTSWGQRCGFANKPGVYVKVSHYKKWIEEIMKTHS